MKQPWVPDWDQCLLILLLLYMKLLGVKLSVQAVLWNLNQKRIGDILMILFKNVLQV